MFSVYHFIWLAICAVLIAGSIVYLKKKKPALRDVLTVCCVICIASELVKVFSMVEIVPSADGTKYYPYLAVNHMPFHLCSIQLITIIYARLAADGPRRNMILAFMYPTCLVGAIFALAMPSIFNTTISANQAFTHPIAYQTFLYHVMLIVLGVYIPMSGEVPLGRKSFFSTLLLLALFGFVSIYVNSMLANAVYEGGVLKSIEFMPNFFFTAATPIGIALTEKWHWLLYFAIIMVLAVLSVFLCFLPFLRKERRLQAK